MKLYTTIFAVLAFLVSACTDAKQQQKDALQEVLKIHDEAMAKSEQAIKGKMLLDSLAKANSNLKNTDINKVVSDLSTADAAMEDWMHQFNADNTGKSHEQIMQYLNDQHKKVADINDRLKSAIEQSEKFISTHKK